MILIIIQYDGGLSFPKSVLYLLFNYKVKYLSTCFFFITILSKQQCNYRSRCLFTVWVHITCKQFKMSLLVMYFFQSNCGLLPQCTLLVWNMPACLVFSTHWLIENADMSKVKYHRPHFFCLPAAAVVYGDDIIPLTPSRMSQRQVKERDKEREKEASLQTPNREHVTSPSTLSPGVSYSHGETHQSSILYKQSLNSFSFILTCFGDSCKFKCIYY